MYPTGSTYTIYTENNYNFDYAWMEPVGYTFAFRVKGCMNAYVLLSEYRYDYHLEAYEIVFGVYSNSASEIRRGLQGPVLAQAATPTIMDCENWRRFWVSWSDEGDITLGTGEVGTHSILHYRDPVPQPTNYISIGTWNNVDLQWDIIQQQGKTHSVCTPL